VYTHVVTKVLWCVTLCDYFDHYLTVSPSQSPTPTHWCRCWAVTFEESDHEFLHQKHVFSEISQLLSHSDSHHPSSSHLRAAAIKGSAAAAAGGEDALDYPCPCHDCMLLSLVLQSLCSQRSCTSRRPFTLLVAVSHPSTHPRPRLSHTRIRGHARVKASSSRAKRMSRTA